MYEHTHRHICAELLIQRSLHTTACSTQTYISPCVAGRAICIKHTLTHMLVRCMALIRTHILSHTHTQSRTCHRLVVGLLADNRLALAVAVLCDPRCVEQHKTVCARFPRALYIKAFAASARQKPHKHTRTHKHSRNDAV